MPDRAEYLDPSADRDTSRENSATLTDKHPPAPADIAALLDFSHEAVVAYDPAFRILYANAEAQRQMGLSLDRLIGSVLWELFPATVGPYHDPLTRAQRERIPLTFQAQYAPNGTWAEGRCVPVEEWGEQRDPVLAVFFRDITHQKQAEGRAESLQRVSAALVGALTQAEVAQVMVAEAMPALDASLGLVAALSEDGSAFHTLGLIGYPPEISDAWRTFPADAATPIGDAVRRSEPILLETLAARRAQYPHLEDIRAQGGSGGLAAIPLLADGRAVGGLVLVFDRDGPFDADRRAFLLTLAGLCAQALGRARLQELAHREVEERQRAESELAVAYRREALLNQIGQAVVRSSDPKEIQSIAATALGAALNVDRCYFNFFSQSQDVTWIEADWHRVGLRSVVGRYPLSHVQSLLLGDLFRHGATLLIEDVRGSFLQPETAALMEQLGYRALLTTPFYRQGELTAVLALVMAEEARSWSREEADLAEAVAALTRAAVEAALLQQREHAIAEQLQDALQPTLPEHILGLSVGRFTKAALEEAQVGGDFYDVFPLDQDLYALVIGDVSGKGLAAAQQLALIRNSLRTTLYLYQTPGQAAASLNAIVTAHELLVGFVTAWVGVYNALTGEILYCSCGHEPGLIRRRNGVVEALETTGPPLGVSDQAAYCELSVTLSSGDTLLLYTDGISESGPSRREMLRTEGLIRLFETLPGDVEVQAEAEALVAAVNTYTNGVFRDDVAVLLARRK